MIRRTRASLDRGSQGLGTEVIQQDDVRLAREGMLELFERIDLDLDEGCPGAGRAAATAAAMAPSRPSE